MFARLIALSRRLTILEKFSVVWIAIAPLVLGVVLMLDVALDSSPAPASIVVVYYLVTIAALLGAVATRFARWRRATAAAAMIKAAPHAIPPLEHSRRGILADEPQPWARLESPALESQRAVRAFSNFSRRSLVSFAMRSKSRWLREPLSYLVSGGYLDYETLERTLIAAVDGDEDAELILGNLDLNLLLSLGRVSASQMLDSKDGDFTLAAYKYVAAHRASQRLTAGNVLFLAEHLILHNEFDIGKSVLATIRGNGMTEILLRADVLNPFLRGSSKVFSSQWLDAVNLVFRPQGLEPVSLRPSGPTPYDRLICSPTSTASDGPLITVIMTCFRPDHALRSAVDSVIAQSWQNWELIISDDASGDEFQPLIDEVAALDPRIRVLRGAQNAGTYVRRNEAIVAARGEFVTMHDSDDWAHPRRLELQVRHLIEHDSLPANLSYSLRVSEELKFAQPRGAFFRLAESSLLFRKERVVNLIGYFDSLRKAADSEFRLRIQAAFHVEVPVIDTLAPLSLIRFASSSLSGSDLTDGWMHPARLAYRSALTLWHHDIHRGIADPLMPFPQTARPFPAHPHLTGASTEPKRLDVLVVFDARSERNTIDQLNQLRDEIVALLEAGQSVGVVQLATLLEGVSQSNLDPVLQRMINSGELQLILCEDSVHATLAVVRNASVLQTRPSTSSGLTADRVIVVEDESSGRDIRGHTYSRFDVEREVRALFGREPEWSTASGPLDLENVGDIVASEAL